MRPIVPDHAKVEIMGLPHHGKVKGGKLLYSGGGIKMDYPQVGSSNVLLAKVKDLPDRTGNALDTANEYEWKDRLLLQIGSVGTVPAAIPDNHLVYLDTNDQAWLIKVEFLPSGYTYQVRLTLVRRFGILQEEAHPDPFNLIFYTSSTISIADYEDSHGANPIHSNFSMSQNPRGDKCLVCARCTFGLNVNRAAVASIAEVTIAGTPDPDTGSGLTGGISEWKAVPDILTSTEVHVEHDEYVYPVEETVTTECTGVPGTGTITFTYALQSPVLASGVSPPPSKTVPLGLATSTWTNQYTEHAFYNENDVAVLVEFRDTEYYEVDLSEIRTYNDTKECIYNVVSGAWPDPDWIHTGGTYTVDRSQQKVRDVLHRETMELIIGGVVKETLIVQESGHSDSTWDDDSSGSSSCASSFINKPCAYSEDTGTIYWGWDYEYDGGPSPTSQTVTHAAYASNNASVLYDGSHPGTYLDGTFLQSDDLQYSNRVFGIEINSTTAGVLSISELNYGAHTDMDGIQGAVDEYAAYDPYNTTVETDVDPIGFV